MRPRRFSRGRHPEIELLFLRYPGAVASFLFSPTRGDPTADRGDAGGAVLPGVNAWYLCLPDRFGKNWRGYLAPCVR